MEFTIDQEVYDEHGFVDEDVAERFTDELMERFAASPEGAEASSSGSGLAWARAAIKLGIRDADFNFAELASWELEFLLVDTFPREVPCAPDDAPAIVGELHALWRFADREFDVPSAWGCLALLESPGLTETVRRAIADPGSWGSAAAFPVDENAADQPMHHQAPPAAGRQADLGLRKPRTDARKARRHKRKAQKRSRLRNR